MTKGMKKNFIILTVSFITGVILIVLCSLLMHYEPEGDVLMLDNGWKMELNDETYGEDASLDDFGRMIPMPLKRGDRLVLSCILPEAGIDRFPTVFLKTQYCAYTIRLDTTVLEEYGADLYEKGSFIGCGYHFISLPEDYAGKRLIMELTIADDNSVSMITTPQLGSQHDLEYGFVNRNIFQISTGIFLIVFGVFFMFITLLFYMSIPGITVQLFSSFLYIDLGIWIMCYYNTAFLFVNGVLMTFAEYFTLYLIMPLLLLVLGCLGQHRKNRIFRIMVPVFGGLPVIFILLHLVGVVYMNRMLTLFHILCLGAFVMLIILIMYDHGKNELTRSEKLQMAGIGLFTTTMMASMLFYFLEHNGLHENPIINGLLPAGSLFFVFAQIVNYYTFISESYARNHEYETLTRMAYEDSLTDLANRSRSERYMGALVETNADYCVISLDLNGLKAVNDNYGHAAGDKYLKEFSQAFKASFSETAFLSRLGGDEFMVILKTTTKEEVAASIDKLTAALDVMNALYPDYRRSVAAGYAFRHEADEYRESRQAAGENSGESAIKTRDKRSDTAHIVYELADARMYEDKKRLHEKLGLGAVR